MTKAPEKGLMAMVRNNRVGLIVSVVALVAAYGIYHTVSGSSAPRKRVMDTVAIKILPPPPPPKQEPPPEPPKIMEKPKIQPPIDKPEEKKQVDEPPPGPLALDAKGGPGSDSFGLGGKPGGADFTGSGNGTRFGHYVILMSNQIEQRLHKDEKLDTSKFRITLAIKVSAAGRIARADVLHTTGDGDLDERIRQAVASMTLPEAPPQDMPTAIVRIGARPTTQT